MRPDRFPSRRRRRWIAPVSAGLIAATGIAWWAMAAGQVAAVGAWAAPVPLPVPAVSTAVPDEQAAPAAGVTGTIALPAMPSFAAEPVSATGTAAPPFSTAQASAVDRARATECLTAAIYYEAASESDAGQRAVAQVVLNRVRHPVFPATVCGVVYQGSERRGCQFSFACDGAMARRPSATAWARAARNAGAALTGGVYAPVGLATHYHTFAVRPIWNRGLVMTDVVGAHFFHRWKGWWGTSAAFGRPYVGGEPVPGPHTPVSFAPTIVAAVASTPVQAVPMLTVPPVAATPIEPTSAREPDRLPPASTVLDRWKDSGKPLR